MRISKVKLINWHAFENETLEFQGNLIITGPNGSGKSTLMDAIYYVLSGGDTKNFNNAANNGDNHKSKRTLETYILHKIGDEGKECLRSRPIIAHICIEFTNDVGGSFLLGAVIELSETSVIEKFYGKNAAKIEDSMFISADNTVYDFSSLQRNAQVDDLTKPSKISRQRTFCKDVFKVNDGIRYMELLQRAISFKPIDEVSDFVDSFLLDEKSIDITPLQEELRSYLEIYNQVRKTKEKIEFLEQFIGNANKYKKCQDDFLCLVPLAEEAKKEKAEVTIQRLEDENKNLSFLNRKLEEETKAITQDTNRKYLEIQNIENNDRYKLVGAKRKEIKEKKERLEYLSTKKGDYDKVLSCEQTILKQFAMDFSFQKDIRDKRFDLFDRHRKEYYNFVKSEEPKLISSRTRLEDKIKILKKEITEKENEIGELQKHHSIYPDEITKFKKLLGKHLNDKYGKNIIIQPLCELVEFKESEIDRWANSIEAYLAPYRFGLIVDHKYYEDCVRYYNQIKDQEEIHDVMIYNADYPPFFSCKAKDNSIFDKLEIEDKRTKYICHQLFNDVVCFDSLNDLLKQNTNGILDNCVIYKERAFSNADPKTYKFPFIGENSFNTRIKFLKEETSEKEKELCEIEKQKEIVANQIVVLARNKANEILQYTDIWGEYDELSKDIIKVSKDLELYESDPGIIALTEKIQQLENDIKSNGEKCDQERQDIRNNDRTIGRNKQTIEDNEKSIRFADEKFNLHFGQHSLAKSTYESFKDAYYKGDGYLDDEKIEKDKSQCNSTIASLTNRLKDKVSEYVSNYNNNLSSDLEDIGAVINEYERLKRTDIIKYELKAKQAQESSESLFRDDFISKLSEHIKEAKHEIDEINKNLAKHPFGSSNEVYRFVCQPSKEEEMRKYYKIITSGKLMDAKDLFSEVLSEEENSIMNELFNKIAHSGTSDIGEKSLARFLDYRKYMTYDIEITNDRKEKTLFSKTHREKSGGETQTPFYVIIASCFDQLMNKKDNNSSCPVIFDEAFNNMDETRIDALMKYYKELDIQLIIVVPSNRLSSLAQFVDSIAALIPNNHQIKIVYMKHDEDLMYE